MNIFERIGSTIANRHEESLSKLNQDIENAAVNAYNLDDLLEQSSAKISKKIMKHFNEIADYFMQQSRQDQYLKRLGRKIEEKYEDSLEGFGNYEEKAFVFDSQFYIRKQHPRTQQDSPQSAEVSNTEVLAVAAEEKIVQSDNRIEQISEIHSDHEHDHTLSEQPQQHGEEHNTSLIGEANFHQSEISVQQVLSASHEEEQAHEAIFQPLSEPIKKDNVQILLQRNQRLSTRYNKSQRMKTKMVKLYPIAKRESEFQTQISTFKNKASKEKEELPTEKLDQQPLQQQRAVEGSPSKASQSKINIDQPILPPTPQKPQNQESKSQVKPTQSTKPKRSPQFQHPLPYNLYIIYPKRGETIKVATLQNK